MNSDYHRKLKLHIDKYVHLVYDVSASYPQSELYGITSQHRRAALSIALNYVEGYARMSKNVLRSFLDISYGSLKESEYLTKFSYERKYISKEKYLELKELEDTIGRMLWGIITKIK